MQVFTDENLTEQIADINIMPSIQWQWFDNKIFNTTDGIKALYFRFVGKGIVEFNSFELE